MVPHTPTFPCFKHQNMGSGKFFLENKPKNVRAKGEPKEITKKREPEKKKRERKREGKGEKEGKKGFCIFMRF